MKNRSLCTFTYLAFVYIKSESIWVASIAHIVMDNSAESFSYFAVIEDQILDNLGLTLTMLTVVAFLYYKKEMKVFNLMSVVMVKVVAEVFQLPEGSISAALAWIQGPSVEPRNQNLTLPVILEGSMP